MERPRAQKRQRRSAPVEADASTGVVSPILPTRQLLAMLLVHRSDIARLAKTSEELERLGFPIHPATALKGGLVAVTGMGGIAIRRLVSLEGGTSVRCEGLGTGQLAHQLMQVLDGNPDDAQWTQAEAEMAARMLEGTVRHVTESEVRYTVTRLVQLQSCHLLLERHRRLQQQNQQQQSRPECASGSAAQEAEQQLLDKLYDTLTGSVWANGKWLSVRQKLQAWSPEAAGTLLAKVLTQRAAPPAPPPQPQQKSQSEPQPQSEPQAHPQPDDRVHRLAGSYDAMQLQGPGPAVPVTAASPMSQPRPAPAATDAAAAAEPTVQRPEVLPGQQVGRAPPPAPLPEQLAGSDAAPLTQPPAPRPALLVPEASLTLSGTSSAPSSPAGPRTAAPSPCQPTQSQQQVQQHVHQQRQQQLLQLQQQQVKDEDMSDAQPARLTESGPLPSLLCPPTAVASVPAPVPKVPLAQGGQQQHVQVQSQTIADGSCTRPREVQPHPTAPQVKPEPEQPQTSGLLPPVLLSSSALTQPAYQQQQQQPQQQQQAANLTLLPQPAPSAAQPTRRGALRLPSYLQPRPRHQASADPGVGAAGPAAATLASLAQGAAAAVSCGTAVPEARPLGSGVPCAPQCSSGTGAASTPQLAASAAAPVVAHAAPEAAVGLPRSESEADRTAAATARSAPAANSSAGVAVPPSPAPGNASGLDGAKSSQIGEAHAAAGSVLRKPAEASAAPAPATAATAPQPVAGQQPASGHCKEPDEEQHQARPQTLPQRQEQEQRCVREQLPQQQQQQQAQIQEQQKQPAAAAAAPPVQAPSDPPLPPWIHPSTRVREAARAFNDSSRTSPALFRLGQSANMPAQFPAAVAAAAAPTKPSQAMQPPAGRQVPAPWAMSGSKTTHGSLHAAPNAAATLPTVGPVASNLVVAAVTAATAVPGSADAAVRPCSVAAAAHCGRHSPSGAGTAAACREAQAVRSPGALLQPCPAVGPPAVCGDTVDSAGVRRQSSGVTSTVPTTYVRLPPAAPNPAIWPLPASDTGAAVAAAADAIEPSAKPRTEGSAGGHPAREAMAGQAAAPGAEHQQLREQAKTAAAAAARGSDGTRRPDAAAQGLTGAAAAALLAAPRAAPRSPLAAAAALPHPPSSSPAAAEPAAQSATGAAPLNALLPSPPSLRAASSGAGGGASFNVLSLLESSSGGALGRRDSASLAPLGGTGSGLLSQSGSTAAAAAAAAAPTTTAPLLPTAAAAPPPAVRKELLDRMHADMAELHAQAAARHAAELHRQEEQEWLRQQQERERELQRQHWAQQESLLQLQQQRQQLEGELARKLEAKPGSECKGDEPAPDGDGGGDGDDGGGGGEDMELASPPSAAGGSGPLLQGGGGGGGARQRTAKQYGKLAWAKRVRAFLRRQPKRRATYGDVVRAGLAIPDFVVPPDNYAGINRYLGGPFFKGFWRFVRTMKKGGGEFCVLEAVPAGGSKGPACKGAAAAADGQIDVSGGGNVSIGGGDGGALPGDSAVAAAAAADGSRDGGGAASAAPSTAHAAGRRRGPLAPGSEDCLSYLRYLYDYLMELPDGLPLKELGRSPVRVPDHFLAGIGVTRWLKQHKAHLGLRSGRVVARPGQRP